MIFVYDVEVFPNFFSMAYWSIDKEIRETLVIYNERNDIDKLVSLFKENHWWVGYNSESYDNHLIQFILNNESRFSQLDPDQLTALLHKESSDIIEDDKIKYRPISFNYIDLMRVAYIWKSLKMVGVDLKHNRIQDLPKHFNHYVEDHEVDEIIEYNHNDVEITLKLYMHQRKKIQLRKDLSKKYGHNLMSLPDSSIADVILENDYERVTGIPKWQFRRQNTHREIVKFEDWILPQIEFKSRHLNKLLSDIKRSSGNKDTKIEFRQRVGETRYDILKGGIHSYRDAEIFEADNEHYIIDADVQSYYPNLMINFGIKPEHLQNSFLTLLEQYTTTRVKAKKDDPVAAAGLKIVILAIFGKMGSPTHFLYDLKAMYGVTLNGQLFLLMLIEALENEGISVFYANTDGVTARVPVDKVEAYNQVCEWWQEITGLTLEFERYKKCINRDVNNYIWIPEDDSESVKYKGFFDYSRWNDPTKGYDKPVIPMSISEYFINGTPVEEFITNHDDIYDFCMAQKVGSGHNVYYRHVRDDILVVDKQQDTNRYYVGKKGGNLFKKKGSRETSLVSNQGVILLNGATTTKASDHPIKYGYYIREAKEVINLFKYKQTDLFQ